MLILSGLYRNAQSPPCEDTNCINRVHRDACSDANRMTNYAGQAVKQGGVTVLGVGVLQSLGWGVTVLGVGVLQSLGGGPASPFDYRAHLALLLRLGRGPPPAEGRGGLGPLSAGASPAAAASLSALPSQYSLHSCCGSSASMASVNCTDINL